MLKAALIGFGSIAKAHRRAFAALKKLGKAELICACDVDPDAFRKNAVLKDKGELISEEISFYTDLDKMISEEKFDFVNICIPTFLHCEAVVKMLKCGYHVLCEKPMALSYTDCEKMLIAARKSEKELMVGQCVRFYPAYGFIKSAIEDCRFGKVTGAHFDRLSPPPVWGYKNWFMDPDCSGGSLADLHVHDVDLIRYLFGEPEAVSCRGNTSLSIHDTVHSSFKYGDIPVTAIGDWSMAGVRFKERGQINFEKATVIFEEQVLRVYPKDGGEAYEPQLKNQSGHFGEIEYFCDVIEGRTKNLKNTAESAALTIKTVQALRESIARGGEFICG